MRTNGPFAAGRIQLTEVTNKFLTAMLGLYRTSKRGEIDVKGKGTMETYLLEERMRGRQRDRRTQHEVDMKKKYRDEQRRASSSRSGCSAPPSERSQGSESRRLSPLSELPGARHSLTLPPVGASSATKSPAPSTTAVKDADAIQAMLPTI